MGARHHNVSFFGHFLALWIAFHPIQRAAAETNVVESVVSNLRNETTQHVPDVFSFHTPMSTCLLILGLFKRRLPTMHQYRRLFRGFNIDSVGRPVEGEPNRREVKTYSTIAPENIESIFTHQYDLERPELLGAKGLLYFDPDGKMRMIVWSPGNGFVGNNIHHKDAVASIIETEANDLTRVIHELEKKGDFASGVLALDLAQELKAVANNLHHNRKQDSFTEEMLHRFQGFQLTAERDHSGKLKIAKVQISSSVTSTQISRHEPLVVNELNRGMALIRDSISPELRDYGPVEIDGLNKMKLDDRGSLGLEGEPPPLQTPIKSAFPGRRRRTG